MCVCGWVRAGDVVSSTIPMECGSVINTETCCEDLCNKYIIQCNGTPGATK